MDLDMDPDLSGFWKAKIRIWQGNDMYKQYKYFFIIPHSPSLIFTVYVTGIDLPLAPAVSVHPCFDFDLYAIWHIRVVGFVFFLCRCMADHKKQFRIFNQCICPPPLTPTGYNTVRFPWIRISSLELGKTHDLLSSCEWAQRPKFGEYKVAGKILFIFVF